MLRLPPCAEVMQSPCSEFPPTTTCPTMRLLTLAKGGTTKEQADRSTSYPDVKIIILDTKQHSKRRYEHPRYNKADPCYLLSRWEQVTVFRPKTGHNPLSYHLHSKLSISHTEQCPCGTGSQTTKHLLQSCPQEGNLARPHPEARKLYGNLEDLRHTAIFIEETGVSISRTRKRRRRTTTTTITTTTTTTTTRRRRRQAD